MSDTTTHVLELEHDEPKAAAGLPRLLAGVSAQGPMGLEEHLATHGELPAAHRRDRRGAQALIDQIVQSGLTGRGGGAFPMGDKLRAVAAQRGRPLVVVNATEGEPASLKDRTLLETLPHLVLDGTVLAARAVGAQEAIVCVCESALAGMERMASAISERAHMSGDWPSVTLEAAPEGYVVGQESALVNHLNGGPAVPTFTPPLPFQQGVRRQPTLVSNAETLAHVAMIARHGPRWFRALGMEGQPGSALVTLSGPVRYPGVYEMEYGASLMSLLDAAGGTTDGRVRAVLFGGYGGTWVDGRALGELALSDEHLAPHYATIGAGVVLLLSSDACPVAEVARVTRWLARQSARQCGPCIHGLDALAQMLGNVASGDADGRFERRTEQLLTLVSRRGACSHPDGAARFVASALDVFAPELADHVQHGTCEACLRPAELPLPVRSRSGARVDG
jgi:NADH:ubiquinone oxidoreductase subunit F (NADH-binding)